MDIFFEEHRTLLKMMVHNKVRFMLIGGYAVIHYGYERSTGDMDVWLETSEDNKACFLKALRDFGITDEGMEHVGKVDFSKPFPVFFFGQRPRRIDFISLIQRVTFKEAFLQASHFLLDGVAIPIIQYHHLILSKQFTGRPQDLADIEKLQQINKHRNSEQ